MPRRGRSRVLLDCFTLFAMTGYAKLFCKRQDTRKRSRDKREKMGNKRKEGNYRKSTFLPIHAGTGEKNRERFHTHPKRFLLTAFCPPR